jgi:hypothetical protein
MPHEITTTEKRTLLELIFSTLNDKGFHTFNNDFFHVPDVISIETYEESLSTEINVSYLSNKLSFLIDFEHCQWFLVRDEDLSRVGAVQDITNEHSAIAEKILTICNYLLK